MSKCPGNQGAGRHRVLRGRMEGWLEVGDEGMLMTRGGALAAADSLCSNFSSFYELPTPRKDSLGSRAVRAERKTGMRNDGGRETSNS